MWVTLKHFTRLVLLMEKVWRYLILANLQNNYHKRQKFGGTKAYQIYQIAYIEQWRIQDQPFEASAPFSLVKLFPSLTD